MLYLIHSKGKATTKVERYKSMMMKDFAEKGYKVVVSSMFGDVEYSLADFENGLEQDKEVFDCVDEDAKIVYFYDGQDYDD